MPVTLARSLRAAVAALPLLGVAVASADPLLPSLGASGTPDVFTGYRLGAGDVVDVQVEGRPDLSGTLTIQTSGKVFLRGLPPVALARLTPTEASARVRAALAEAHVTGAVRVSVREVQSQFVTVAGAVLTPGRRPVVGSLRLVDVLTGAGGLRAEATGEVSVMRREGTFPDGTHLMRFQIPGPANAIDVPTELETALIAGDLVSIPERVFALVQGEVKKPGRYVVGNGVTLTQALKAAGGRTRFGKDEVLVERFDGGEREAILVDVDAVADGEANDLVLHPDDRVTVGVRTLF